MVKANNNGFYESHFLTEDVFFMVELANSKEEKLDTIDFLAEAIRNDIKYDYLTKIIYYGEQRIYAFDAMPIHIKDEKGKVISYIEKGEKNISLKDDCVFTIPESTSKLFERIIEQKNKEFIYSKYSQKAIYYEPLDICVVINGRHSISAGIIYKKGTIKAKAVDISPLFDCIYTDGYRWLYINTGEVIKEVYDSRLAALYELMRMKNRLLNEEEAF